MTNDSFAERLGLWALAAFAPVLMLIGTNVDRNYQTDFWHHLARGQAMVEQGQLLNHDIYTCTVSGDSFRDPNWLTQIFYYLVYREGGIGLMRVVNSLFLAAMMALLVYLCWRAGGNLLLATSLGCFAFFGLWQLVGLIRPQTFSFLLFLLVYDCLNRAETNRRWLVVPPILIALWTNIHGAFPIGLVLVFAFLLAAVWTAVQRTVVGEPAKGRESEALATVPFSEGSGRRILWNVFRSVGTNPQVIGLTLCFLVSILATGLNPYGFGLYPYIVHTSTLARERAIMEWLPPAVELFITKIWITTILLALVILALSPRRASPREICLIVCVLPLTFGAVRMVAWWLLVAMPIIAAHLGPVITRVRRPAQSASSSLLMAGLCLATLLIAVVATLPGADRLVLPPEQAKPAMSPEEMDLAQVVQRMRELPRGQGHVFARFEWGEYLGWALQPEGYRMFVDGRIEMYPDKLWDEYLALLHGRADWQEILDRYGVDWLVLDNNYSAHRNGLIPLVRRSGNWQEVKVFASGDHSPVLFVKNPARSRPSPGSQAAVRGALGAQ